VTSGLQFITAEGYPDTFDRIVYNPFLKIPPSTPTYFATHVRAAYSIFDNCEDVRHFSQHSHSVTINSHNGQLTLYTD
jgi:hypothetical protein